MLRTVMANVILEAEGISKYYYIGGQRVTVLDDISLAVRTGEFLAITGSSGSGKTTLLSVLSGLDKPEAGRIVMDGRNITHFDEDELAPIRNRSTGFVFQSFHLIPSLNCLENVMFPAELNKDRQAREKAERLLQRAGLDRRRHNFPDQLSGGEQQRVAICRALINEPKIVFADEPTGNLDSENSKTIINLMLELHRDHTMTLVMATHSHSLSSRADRVIRLHDGRIDLTRQEGK
ncbi:MAG: ABC transporter ATP-binding protein [Desulforhopalus sp.]